MSMLRIPSPPSTHRRSKKRQLIVLFILLMIVFPASAQVGRRRTVGVLVNTEAAYEGYTLFSQKHTPSVYLIDNDGRVIHTWEIENTAAVLEAHLLDNGHLVVVAGPRTASADNVINIGSIREYTWDNAFVWEYVFDSVQIQQHHAIDILPNGNILAITRYRRPINEALAMGLKPAFSAALQKHPLFADIIVEIDPSTNEIVWQWDPWDHLAQDLDADLPNYGQIAQHPQRIDINYQTRLIGGMNRPYDWMHTNSVHYHPEWDQIVISVREFNEFWIISRSASTAEATGPAGDLLWRWGNPAAYQQGDPVDDRQLFLQHDVQWIEDGLPGAGNILIFNNQNIGADGEKYSSALELKPPLRPDGGYDWEREAEIVWSYRADGFLSRALSGVQRLPNGNTLITEGQRGRLIEVSADGEVVWEFVNPVTARGLIKQGDPPNPRGIHFSQRNDLFRVRKYPPDHPAFAGRDMTPGDRLVD